MSDAKQDFERIRDAALAADQALAAALSARAKAVTELAELRRREPDAYYSLPRDSEVIGRVLELVQVFPKDAVPAVMKEVLSGCAGLVAPIEVVYAGQEGGIGHLAARTQFGTSARLRAVDSAETLLSEIARGHAAFGLLPFETSYDGAVTQTLNLLARSDVKICAEVPIRRAFHLLSKSGERSDVKKIYAAPSSLAACEKYLAKNFPRAVLIDTRSHLLAAQNAKEDPDAAALGTDVAAELTGLAIVERSVEDVPDLDTCYVAVGNDHSPRTGLDRTAVVVALHDAPGVLIDCLRPFADRKINVYRLETRPARGWEFRYLILVEVDGHITDRSVLAAVEDLRTAGRYVKVLGSYPRVKER
ncbi:MAG TPA: prephenate dehydratase domain-containing protein [Polyangiales bacterium]|nr:prephenate dehydratase domain-containing protein [Polyangiales bacterium]